jgi:hypothetical protein
MAIASFIVGFLVFLVIVNCVANYCDHRGD